MTSPRFCGPGVAACALAVSGASAEAVPVSSAFFFVDELPAPQHTDGWRDLNPEGQASQLASLAASGASAEAVPVSSSFFFIDKLRRHRSQIDVET